MRKIPSGEDDANLSKFWVVLRQQSTQLRHNTNRRLQLPPGMSLSRHVAFQLSSDISKS